MSPLRAWGGIACLRLVVMYVSTMLEATAVRKSHDAEGRGLGASSSVIGTCSVKLVCEMPW